ncbi:hypothetical protein BDW02DRAFT_228744 [Decorospora gaudefroyi]|uniref:RlpA-like protein double-psi beta-barrel domain-containing protein n=1 Tax=Decorospora gaudefroyi TaxID=184978 RepID=A0A6A5KUW9_9PLEO|nr:hypothetical protein BDW02DRAFT_228744 [Decorospora gaudefroyi]
MKTSAVLVSLLFGSFAVAAPVDKRAIIYHTEIVTETVIVYTTVWDDEPVAAPTTTTDGAFYEEPKPAPTSAVVEPVSSAAPISSAAPVNTPAPVVESSSVYTPPVVEIPTSTSTPTPTPTPAPAPETSAEAPVPAPVPTTTKAAPKPPAPVIPSAAAAPVPASASGDMEHNNVDMTIYDNNGTPGACGKKLYDTDVVVALAKPTWGESTHDPMTGESSNPWCGQKIRIQYEGNEIEAEIQDLCMGCVGADIDLSLAAWTKLTGLEEKTRLKASWSVV